jgi:hypothetical protein
MMFHWSGSGSASLSTLRLTPRITTALALGVPTRSQAETTTTSALRDAG